MLLRVVLLDYFILAILPMRYVNYRVSILRAQGKGIPYSELYGEALPERGIFFKVVGKPILNGGFSRAGLYRRVGKTVI